MAEYTTNYNLKKPDQNEFYNIDDFNGNADIIDEALKNLSDGIGQAIDTNIKQVKVVSVPASGWSASAPYMQTLVVNGMTAGDSPVISPHIDATATAAQEKTIKKCFSCLSAAETQTGAIQLTCIGKKPEADFSINIKGA